MQQDHAFRTITIPPIIKASEVSTHDGVYANNQENPMCCKPWPVNISFSGKKNVNPPAF